MTSKKARLSSQKARANRNAARKPARGIVDGYVAASSGEKVHLICCFFVSADRVLRPALRLQGPPMPRTRPYLLLTQTLLLPWNNNRKTQSLSQKRPRSRGTSPSKPGATAWLSTSTPRPSVSSTTLSCVCVVVNAVYRTQSHRTSLSNKPRSSVHGHQTIPTRSRRLPARSRPPVLLFPKNPPPPRPLPVCARITHSRFVHHQRHPRRRPRPRTRRCSAS